MPDVSTSDTIERRGDKYVLLSSTGEVLGKHDTEAKAQEQERAIEAAKAASRDDVHARKKTADAEDWAYTEDFAPFTHRKKVDSRDANGFLRANATVTAPGVYAYIRDGKLRHELKPAEEIFADVHMASVHGAVVTDGHPPNAMLVTPENSIKLQRGHSMSAPVASADGMLVDLVVTDAALIEDAESGRKTGVSLGMRNTFDFTPGVWTASDGSKHPYDAIQRHMVTNHIAIVNRPRVTSAQLHLDSLEQDNKQEEQHMDKATLTIDGAEFEVDKNVASIVKAHLGRRDKELETTKSKLEEAATSYDSLTEEKDTACAERDTLKAECDTLKEKLATADAVNIGELVTKRLAFLDRAKLVLTADKYDEVKDKDDLEIMRFTCDSCGVKNVAEESEAYIRARFDGLVDASSQTNDSKFVNAAIRQPLTLTPTRTSERNDINARMAAHRAKQSGKAVA